MKKFNRTLIGALLPALLGSTAAFGAPLTPEEALQRAASTESAPRLRALASAPNARLVYTAKAAGQPGCYVFDIAGHGLVVSADDLALPILGYSDEIVAANGEIAPALQYWLDCLSAQIENARTGGTRTVYNFAPRSMKVEIPPMVTTRWNQNSPYNMLCPMTEKGRSMTGCVATAMSQAIRYHNYPVEGIGTHSYDWNGTTLSFDYGNTEFDWANMTDTYSAASTEAENLAVATLMYAAGVGVDMNYSASSSGATSLAIPRALVDNFGYDKGTHYESRSWYSPSQWEDVVYDQLKYGPIIYGGASNDGGHSFICDGYDGKGLFHFNWGWGGMSDGYYALNALDPMQQGIGGSSGGYDFYQDIIAGMRTPQPGSEYEIIMATQSAVIVSKSGSDLVFNGPFFNFGNATAPLVLLGVRFEGNGIDKVFYATSYQNMNVNSGFYYFSMPMPAELADGTYTMTPVYSVQFDKNNLPDVADMEWTPIKIPYDYAQQFYLTIDGDDVDITESESVEVDVEGIRLLSPIYAGKPFSVEYTLNNPTGKDYCGPLAVIFFTTDLQAAYATTSQLVTVPAHTTTDVTQNTSIAFVMGDLTTIEPGNYYIAIAEGSRYTGLSLLPAGAPLPVSIETAPALEYSVTNLRATDGSTEHMNPDALSFSADVTVTSGIFNERLLLGVFRDGETTSTTIFPGSSTLISEGETKTVTFTGNIPDFTDGETFSCAVFSNNSQQLTAPLYFTVGIQTGIDGVEAINDAEYYDLSGRRVEASALTDGQPYIVVKREAKGTLSRNKMIFKK